LDLALEMFYQEEVKLNAVPVPVGVGDGRDLGTDRRANSQLLVQFPLQSGHRLLAYFDLAPGKLPLQRHRLVLRPLAYQHLRSIDHQGGDHLLHERTARACPAGSKASTQLVNVNAKAAIPAWKHSSRVCVAKSWLSTSRYIRAFSTLIKLRPSRKNMSLVFCDSSSGLPSCRMSRRRPATY